MDYLTQAMQRDDRMTLEAFSALPDAPVVPYVEPAPRVRRARAATAAALHRLGDALGTGEPGVHVPGLG